MNEVVMESQQWQQTCDHVRAELTCVKSELRHANFQLAGKVSNKTTSCRHGSGSSGSGI